MDESITVDAIQAEIIAHLKKQLQAYEDAFEHMAEEVGIEIKADETPMAVAERILEAAAWELM